MRLLLGILAVALTSGLEAQTVRGQLIDSISRSPISGAFLTLVDLHGVERARAITNRSGQFTVTAPDAGVYRLRSKRIGFRPSVSPPLSLRAGETISYDAAIDPIPIALREVVIAGDRQCNVEAGASVAALWEEVREALAAVAWTSRAPGYWYEILHFDRQLSAAGRPVGPDSAWLYTSYQQVPVRSAPAEQLTAKGYVVVGADGWTFYGPDADVLLSDPFLRTHCFETKIGRGETAGLVGLGFSPARGRTLPDVIGTLWVDRATAELRHLEFTYTRLPRNVAAPLAGGRVEFMRVPTGAWIVRDWTLRMPLAKTTRTPSGHEGPPQVFGFRESGERAIRIKTELGAVVYAESIATTAAVAATPAAPEPFLRPVPAPVRVAEPVRDTTTNARARLSRSPNLLLEDEFEGAGMTDAFALVQHYRPQWLRSRGPASFLDPSAGTVQVYVDNFRMGDVNRLHDIPAEEVIEMRYLSGPEATTRYGTGHAGGVIEVRRR